jgi:hypothetical protein
MQANSTQLETELALGAGVLSVVTLLSVSLLVGSHMRAWSTPVIQTRVVRIVLMPLVYALCSLAAIMAQRQAVYIELVRDCYEAFALYQFFWLLLAHLQESDAAPPEFRTQECDSDESDRETFLELDDVSEQLRHLPSVRHPPPLCCLGEIQPGTNAFMALRRGILQYVFIRPACALVACVLQALGMYEAGTLDPEGGFMWLTLVVSISLTVALYALYILYDLVEEQIRAARPTLKFVALKLMLIVMFWQAIAIAGLYHFGWLQALAGMTTQASADLICNFLICCEAAVIALAHHWIFSARAYYDREAHSGWCDATRTFIWRVVNPRDILKDTEQTLGL